MSIQRCEYCDKEIDTDHDAEHFLDLELGLCQEEATQAILKDKNQKMRKSSIEQAFRYVIYKQDQEGYEQLKKDMETSELDGVALKDLAKVEYDSDKEVLLIYFKTTT